VRAVRRDLAFPRALLLFSALRNVHDWRSPTLTHLSRQHRDETTSLWVASLALDIGAGLVIGGYDHPRVQHGRPGDRAGRPLTGVPLLLLVPLAGE
jgi:hypothetical protein